MPKIKNRGAAKRFKVSGSGAIKAGSVPPPSYPDEKSTKRKRQCTAAQLHRSDVAAARRMIPYA